MDNLGKIMEMEGDKREFFYDGYFCLIKRGPMGSLCGYVGLPKKLLDKNSDYYWEGIPCHGGVTFEGEFKEYPDLYLIGFDCAHSGDLVPAIYVNGVSKYSSISGMGEYRDMYYVQDELEEMVEYLQKDLEGGKRIGQKDYPAFMQDIDK